MNVRRLQGLALILSAVCLLLALAAPSIPISDVSVVVGIILFMLGIPAIVSVQPSGWVGLVGILLLELAALIALGFQLELVPSSVGSSLSLTSAMLGMLGAVIIGWLTIREHIFPAYVGWVFIVQGLLNFIFGLFHFGSLAGVLPILLSILYAVALFAYGYFIYQTKNTTANKFKAHVA